MSAYTLADAGDFYGPTAPVVEYFEVWEVCPKCLYTYPMRPDRKECNCIDDM